ncbi:transglutaminase domain-containing protein [Flavobacterium aquicola]|uniref:Transglutaminase-like putative cysteine protease n=1 Tax=Flavobacterium aquicola TaxID=1682742 RepID=A0A3E0EQD4_9FLAO|nr:transglutaminase domain-containing protein [Flavobacterium aquicola]REH00455.1 transglutaminase-like putative cysteine protease [Flavobacterium aquicola]
MKFSSKKTLFIFLFSITLFGQKNIEPTLEDISSAKTLRAKYDKDDIAILESTENISFDLNKAKTKVQVKNSIKELLMNINHRADINKYEFYDSESKIESFSLKYRNQKEAYFPVKDEFYKDDDLFYNDAKVMYMTVDFPVQGYTYNYSLEKKYEDVKYFTSLYFNDEYPVIKKTINITVPNWLNLELKEFNFEAGSIVKTAVPNPANSTTTYTYTVSNMPAFTKEENTPGKSYLYPHILLIAKSFKNKETVTPLFNSTADLYKWYKSLIDMMKDDPNVMKEKVKELTANAKTDEEKIKNIYYWVQDNIRYIAFEDGIAGFKPDESNNVFEKRYGDCKGMANLNKQMLKLAGFDARLTWIGTKHIAYDYSTPSVAVDNHMICTLFYKGKKYFIDGTEKYNSLGEYAERIQGKEVMIENGDDFIIEKIPLSTSEANKEAFTVKLKIDGEKLVGTSHKEFVGESRTQFLDIYQSFQNNDKKETLERYLSKSDKNIEVSAIKTSDLKNRDQKLTLDYNVSVSNKVSGFENEIYVDLEYMNEYKLFDLKDRKTDYQFRYKTDYESNVTLEVPKGYKVTKLPENLSIQEKDFSVQITFQQIGNSIVYKKVFNFKNAVIKVSDITKWNNFNKKLNAIYNQQITLVK